MFDDEVKWISVGNAVARYNVDLNALEKLVRAKEIKHKIVVRGKHHEHFVENTKLLARLKKNRRSVYEIAGTFMGHAIVSTGSALTAHGVINAVSKNAGNQNHVNLLKADDPEGHFHFRIDRSEVELQKLARICNAIAIDHILPLPSDYLVSIFKRLIILEKFSIGTSVFVPIPLRSTESNSIADFIDNCCYGNYHFMLPGKLSSSSALELCVGTSCAKIPIKSLNAGSGEKSAVRSRDFFAALQQVAVHESVDLGELESLDDRTIDLARIISEMRLFEPFT